MKRALVFIKGDIKNTLREPILVLSLLAPLIITLFLRYIVPLITQLLLDLIDFPLSEHYLFIASFFISLTPMIIGTLMGFIILDEKDQKILSYLAVTPLKRTNYIIYRIITPLSLSFVLSFLIIAFSGLLEVDFLRQMPIVLMAALEAPILAFFLGIFAGNKVEGLALSKAMGFVYLAPLAGYLVKSNWQLLAGLFPPYWVSKALLNITTGGYWFYLLVGILVHSLYLYILIKKFNRLNV